MNKIAVVYWSGTGNTEAMAGLVAEGAVAAGGQAELYSAAQFAPELAGQYPAIAFGCPAMGAEQLEELEFEPMFQAVKPHLGAKPIALFGSYSWADGEWMRIWSAQCEEDGLNQVAEPVIAFEAPDADAAQACRALGEALAKA